MKHPENLALAACRGHPRAAMPPASCIQSAVAMSRAGELRPIVCAASLIPARRVLPPRCQELPSRAIVNDARASLPGMGLGVDEGTQGPRDLDRIPP